MAFPNASPAPEISWRVARHVWWAQFWRVAAICLAVPLLIGVGGWLAGATVNDLLSGAPGAVVFLAFVAYAFAVQIWAVRASLAARYQSFVIRVDLPER
jgi:uncharacterized membrane protein YbhN (UPF0104 family)